MQPAHSSLLESIPPSRVDCCVDSVSVLTRDILTFLASHSGVFGSVDHSMVLFGAKEMIIGEVRVSRIDESVDPLEGEGILFQRKTSEGEWVTSCGDGCVFDKRELCGCHDVDSNWFVHNMKVNKSCTLHCLFLPNELQLRCALHCYYYY